MLRSASVALAGALLLLFSRGAAGGGDSRGRSPLIEAEALAQPEFARSVRILDVRPWRHYADRHVPGAVWIDLEAWDEAANDGKGVPFWQKEIGALGIDVNSTVVVYDNGTCASAATILWILRYWGVEDVRLLNAGWPGWLFARKPSTRARPKVTAWPIRLQPQYARRSVKSQVLEIVESRREQLIDVRSDGEFSGIKSKAAHAGRIPSARHIDGAAGLDSKQHLSIFKSVEGLTRLFRSAGIDPTLPITIYGQAGDRGALMAFNLELIGARSVSVYYRGWDEWGNAKDTPVTGRPAVVTSAQPGSTRKRRASITC